MPNLMFTSRVLAGAILTCTLGTASAADISGTVSRVEGTAFVSQSSGYAQARAGMKVVEGDRLMVTENGSLVIDFSDECRYTMDNNEILTIGEVSACAQMDPNSGVAQAPGMEANGFQQAAISPPTPPDDGGAYIPPAEGGGVSPWLIGGAVVVAAGVIIAANDDDDDDDNRWILPGPSPR
mgnify:FL=1